MDSTKHHTKKLIKQHEVLYVQTFKYNHSKDFNVTTVSYQILTIDRLIITVITMLLVYVILKAGKKERRKNSGEKTT